MVLGIFHTVTICQVDPRTTQNIGQMEVLTQSIRNKRLSRIILGKYGESCIELDGLGKILPECQISPIVLNMFKPNGAVNPNRRDEDATCLRPGTSVTT